MGRFLTLLTLVILGALAVRTQQPNPYTTHGSLNGLVWRHESDDEKLVYVAGAMDGYVQGVCEVVWRLKSPSTPCASEIPAWVSFPVTSADIVREMNMFYSDGANISLPMIKAYIYCNMKLGGASKAELDLYLKFAK